MNHPVQAFDVRFNQTRTGPLLVRGMEAFELNDVSLSMWRRCDGRHSEQDIAREIAEEFAVEPAQAAGDVREFLSALRHARLVEG
jgi:hypothetical protein